MHERSLQMLGELFALERGAEIFTRDGRTLREGELLDQPGLVQTLGALADEGAASVYRGSIAEALLEVDGVVLDAESLASYRPVWREPLIVDYQVDVWRHAAACRGSRSCFRGFHVSAD